MNGAIERWLVLVVGIIAAVAAGVRAIIWISRLVDSVAENTRAIDALTKEVRDLRERRRW